MNQAKNFHKPLKWRKSYSLQYIVDLITELVRRDIKLQYKRSALGIVWSFITPLMQLIVYYFLFKVAFSVDIPNYAAFIFCGMLVWTWFQMSLYRGAGAITDNRDLVRQPGFPVAVLPIVAVVTNFVQFLFSLPILLIFLSKDGLWVSPALIFLPVLVAIQFLLTLSFSYLLASINVTFRDTQHILNILLNLFFYLTPVFYETDFIPQEYLAIYYLNPLVSLIQSYRDILINGKLPQFLPLALISIASIFLLILSFKIFERARYNFVEEL